MGRWGLATRALTVAAGMATFIAPAAAQISWPWDSPPPVQRQPAQQPAPQWRPPAEPAPGPQPPAPLAGGSKPPICLQLEQRLVQEGSRGNQSRELIPMVETQLRQADQQLRATASTLERSNCYDYFLFSKTLRQTRKCVDLARSVETFKRQVADLEVQRKQLIASSGQSYQDDIIRELARNNCGNSYAQQAARRDNSNPFSSLWQEESGGSGGGGLGSFSNLPYATYRTMCVRLCDGYYFPISFSTLPNHFERDAATCQSKCASPAELFYYQNPGGAVEQMVGAQSNQAYTQMRTAFRYRKEVVQGCSCKEAELIPQTPVPQQQGAATGGVPPETGSTGSRPAEPQSTGTAASGWSSETTTP
jgi:hypothetical protein